MTDIQVNLQEVEIKYKEAIDKLKVEGVNCSTLPTSGIVVENILKKYGVDVQTD